MELLAYSCTKQYYSSETNEYIMSGFWPIDGIVEAYIDDELQKVRWIKQERISLFERNLNRDMIQECHGIMALTLSENVKRNSRLSIYATIRGQQRLWFSTKIEDIFSDNGNSNDKIKSFINRLWRKINKKLHKYQFHAEGGMDKSCENVKEIRASKDYETWCNKYALTHEQELAQKKRETAQMPLLSIILTDDDISNVDRNEIKNRLAKQTYAKWEIIYPESQNRMTTENMLKAANGEYLVFWNSSDILSKDALFEIAFAIEREPDIDVIYADDDDQTDREFKYKNPRFKPDFNLELLRSYNYIGRFFVVKRELVNRIGCLNYLYGKYKEYDFLLRCSEGRNNIYHIPRILSHIKPMEYQEHNVQREILENHFERLHLPIIIQDDCGNHIYHAKYVWKEKPLVSIIIPNKDHVDDLKRCIESIEQISDYQNLEFIIVENNSVEKETFAFYEKLQKNNEKIKVVYWKDGFNYSAINNFGISYARGDYYLLLNNDTSIINAECISELLGYCMQEDVGAVGARLYYEDDTIQHAGVIVGWGGIAGHAFSHETKNETGYMNRIVCCQEYSALTAACLMVKKSVFEKVDGLSEELAVAFNDVDFCLKIREAGYRIVYNPYAELYHYESKSRGSEDTPEKVARFHSEIRRIEEKWPEILLKGDPHYNKNLSLEHEDYSIRWYE